MASDLKTVDIRQSEIGVYMECRRKWMLDYLRSLELARPANAPAPNLSLGSILHTAIERFWTDQISPVKTVCTIEQEIIAALPEGEVMSEQWCDIFKYLRIMTQGYDEWVSSGATMNHDVIGVEQQLRVLWGTIDGVEVWITGKIDRLVRDRFTEELILIDVKSVQSFLRMLTHARQLMTYAVLLRRTGLVVERLATEQVRKVLRTATAKPPFFDVVEMYCNEEMLDTHEAHMSVVIAEMIEMRARWEQGDESRLYPNPTGDCSWKCDFLPVCMQMDNGENFEHTLQIAFRPKTGDHY